MVSFIHLNIRMKKLMQQQEGANIYLGDHYGNIIWMKYAGNTEKDYQVVFQRIREKERSVFMARSTINLSERQACFGDLQYRYIDYKMEGAG
ncbi:MAG: hypothetical protein MZV63_17055 [Marinilabiliales bacterium]|nr:hypothetical protein [Marinilabiliales bacterium]